MQLSNRFDLKQKEQPYKMFRPISSLEVTLAAQSLYIKENIQKKTKRRSVGVGKGKVVPVL
jgi:hypothetical protein